MPRSNARSICLVASALIVAALHVATSQAGAANSSAPVNPAPTVVPALQQWTGATGALHLGTSTRIVVPRADRQTLRGVADQLRADLRELTGLHPDIVYGAARDRDIALDLDPTADVGPTELADKEGYRLSATDGVDIVSRTSTGAYWATRSLLQMMTVQSHTEVTVPRGSTVDWPNVAVRGFMLDVGRRWFGQEFIRDYVRHLSWFKLNTFQLHLNDNQIQAPGGDWSKAYSAFRLASDNPKYAGLAAEDGAFTRADWNRLEDVAASRFVTVVPEIDAPAHARAFIEFKPELGLNGGNSDHLDLSKPETTQFMKDIYDEFAPWFRAPALHVGADEYPREFAGQYRDYVNEIAAHVRGLGKEVRAWGSLSVMSGGADGYDRDITMHSWNNGWYGPKQTIADGYPLINTNDGLLYIVPFANYYHGHGLDGRWLFANWEPHVFPGSESVDPGEPLLRGAMSAVWNDLVDAEYDGPDVHGLVEPTFGLLAQKMWRGVQPGQTYEQFMAAAGTHGVGPGMEGLRTTLPGGDPLLTTTLDPIPVLAAGESVTVRASVANTGAYAVSRPRVGLDLDLPGVQVTPGTNGPRELEPGATGTWTWTVAADRAVTTGAAKASLTVTGDRRGHDVESRAFATVRAVEAAPAGTSHLSFTATASASSVEADLDRLAARHVNDGNLGTRWASNYTDGEWVQLELAQPSRVSSVRLFWEAACAATYRIQTSVDGTTWHDAATVDPSNCGTETIALDAPGAVKYVRVQGVKRQTTYGYSLHEIWVFGTPST